MKIVFLGGGSLRLIPVLRNAMEMAPEAFSGGEIRLADKNLQAAEAVAALLKHSPEFPPDCRVVASDDTDRLLEGCDLLYLTMAAQSEPQNTLADLLGKEYGFISSDQLSIHGAFLALKLGPLILSLAKKLERVSPQAKMLIFPNPVAVYSGMVNNHTKIPALGICAGFNNHAWDLSRICGRDEFDPDWKVVAAGVNHLSFILRGSYHGENLISIMDRTLKREDWKCMRLTSVPPPFDDYYRQNLDLYAEFYRRDGTLIFSTEGDGFHHLLPSSWVPDPAGAEQARKAFDAVSAREKEIQTRKELYQVLYDTASGKRAADWKNAELLKKDVTDITGPILRALSGKETMRIIASRPNFGAVRGFEDRTVLEYTMDLSSDAIVPVPDQFVPSPWKGLIASLAEFQTLLGDALAENDPRLFAEALAAYPMHRSTPGKKEFIRKMFAVYGNLKSDLLAAERYFR